MNCVREKDKKTSALTTEIFYDLPAIMTVAEQIRSKLETSLSISHLEVVDESHLHAGHAGARPEGETHFSIDVESCDFAGLSRVACQRRINEILKEELAGPVHALSIKARAPKSSIR